MPDRQVVKLILLNHQGDSSTLKATVNNQQGLFNHVAHIRLSDGMRLTGGFDKAYCPHLSRSSLLAP